MNNPLKYTDPSGENPLLLIGIAVGVAVNLAVNASKIHNGMDFYAYAFTGAFTGALGGIFGAGVGVAQGAMLGAASGFSAGFVAGAGNAWIAGEDVRTSLRKGLQGGLMGGAIGAVAGGVRANKMEKIFSKGCVEMGVDPAKALPATDATLEKAREAWFPNAPRNQIDVFTVENVPKKHLTGKNGLITKNAAGKTIPLSENEILTGKSNVYFNKNLAFSSSKQLFYTMGHEFVHVSQFAALSGQSSSIITEHFINMLEFHAYNYSSQLGQEFMTPMFSNGEIQGFMNSSPDYFYKLGWNNFRWTYNYRFIDPF